MNTKFNKQTIFVLVVVVVLIVSGILMFKNSTLVLENETIPLSENKTVKSSSDASNATLTHPCNSLIAPCLNTEMSSDFSFDGFVVNLGAQGAVGCGILPNGEITDPCPIDFLVLGKKNEVIDNSNIIVKLNDSKYVFVDISTLDLSGNSGNFPVLGKKYIFTGYKDNAPDNYPYSFKVKVTKIIPF